MNTYDLHEQCPRGPALIGACVFSDYRKETQIEAAGRRVYLGFGGGGGVDMPCMLHEKGANALAGGGLINQSMIYSRGLLLSGAVFPECYER